MSWFSGATEKIAKFHKDLIETQQKYDFLDRHVENTFINYQKIIEDSSKKIEKQDNKILQLEKEHFREVTELNTKIEHLNDRLTLLSESALHAVTEKLVNKKLENKKSNTKLIEAESQLCQGRTKQNKPCSNRTKHGKFCSRHRPL